jgi:2-dehydro-3-deoxyphosphooctonate aldolase (KDO 8-P synthase)
LNLAGFDVGLDRPLFLIAGPCVVESRQLQMDVAGELKAICASLRIPFIFKSSYDKANRSSHASFRGPGMEEGLRILADVRKHVEVPVLTDVHTVGRDRRGGAGRRCAADPGVPVPPTDFIQAVASAGKPVNIKKGQFLAPEDMKQVVPKAKAASRPTTSWCASAARPSAITTSCPDMRALAIMRDTGCPVVFDATHSVQLPAGRARPPAASASSCPCWRAPPSPPASGGSSWRPTRSLTRRCPTVPTRGRFARMRALLETLVELDAAVKRKGFPEAELM